MANNLIAIKIKQIMTKNILTAVAAIYWREPADDFQYQKQQKD
jgi:hypothetical protein